MLLRSLGLVLIISLEASLGLPLFFLYFSLSWTNQWSVKQRLLAQFLMSFLLAIFYSVSWPLVASLLLSGVFISQQFARLNRLIAFWLLYIIVVGLLYYLAAVQLQLLGLLHVVFFFGYLWFHRQHHRHAGKN